MQIHSWMDKKNKICQIINDLCRHYGEDDLDLINEYCHAIIETHRFDLQKALDCFLDLEKQLEFMPRMVRRGTISTKNTQ
jgi:hypothetical protein